MKLYRLLYGTGPDGTYGTLSEDPGLRSFLLRDIGADTPRSVIDRTMGVFGAFQALSDYARHDRNNLPMMVRYAPMHLRVFPGMPLDIRPFCVVGASGNEGLSRNTTYTQMDFFSMEQLYNDPEHSYLDYLLGLQAFDRQDVDQIRSGRLQTPAPVPRKIVPVMRSQDKEHVLKAVSALFDQKLVVIRLEPGASFVSRAREILSQIYSLLPISYAAQVGYSIYQSPSAIQEVTKYWSFRIFVVPAEEYVDPTDPSLQYIDMTFSEWNNSSELNRLLKSLWNLSWEKRLLLLKALPPISNLEEFLNAVRPPLEAAVDLDLWCSDPPAASVRTLPDLWRIFEAHPKWSQIPWAMSSVRECLSTILQPGLTIEQINARAYASLYASEQHDPWAEKLLKFGQFFGAIDHQSLCSYVDTAAQVRARTKVQDEIDALQQENQTLDFELNDTKSKLSSTERLLETTTEDLNRANAAVRDARTELDTAAREANAKLQDVFDLVDPPVAGISAVASWPMLKHHINSLLLDRQQMERSKGYLQQLQVDPADIDAQTKVNELIATSGKLAEAKGYLSRVDIDSLDSQTAEHQIGQILGERLVLDNCRKQFQSAGKPTTDLSGQIETLLQIEQVLAESGIPTQNEASVRTGLGEINKELCGLRNENQQLNETLTATRNTLRQYGLSEDPELLKKRLQHLHDSDIALMKIRQNLGLPPKSKPSDISAAVSTLNRCSETTGSSPEQAQRQSDAEKELGAKQPAPEQQWADGQDPKDRETQRTELENEVVPPVSDEPRMDTDNGDDHVKPDDPIIHTLGPGDDTPPSFLDKLLNLFRGPKDRTTPANGNKLRPFLPWLLLILLCFVFMILSLKSCGDIGPTKPSTAPTSSASVPDTTDPSETTAPSDTTDPTDPAGPSDPAGPTDPAGPSDPAGPTDPVSHQTVISIDPNAPVERKPEFEDWSRKPYDDMRNAVKGEKGKLKFERDKKEAFFTKEECDLVPEVAFALNGDPVQNKPFAVLLSPKDDCTSFILPDDANAVICCGSNVIAVYEGNSADTDNVDELTLTAIKFMRAMLKDGQMQIQPKLYCLKDANGRWIDHGVKIRELTGDPDWFYNITDFTTDEKDCESLKDEYQLPAVPMLSLESENWHIMILEGGHDAASVNQVVLGTQIDCDGLFILCKMKDTPAE